MKSATKSLIVMLSLMMSLMIGGCGDDPNDPNNDNKIVAPEYRGTYKEMGNQTNPYTMVLGEKTAGVLSYGAIVPDEGPAWTVGNVLWLSDGYVAREYGKFEGDMLVYEDDGFILRWQKQK